MATQAAEPVSDTAPRIPDDIATRISSAQAYGEWEQVNRDFKWLRANMPLAVAEPEGYDPFWVVTKHADIQEIGRQPLIFNNADPRYAGSRGALISKAGLDMFEEAARATGKPQTVRSLVSMDPPEHGPFRKLTFADFAPRGIKGLEEDIRALALEAMAEMEATGGTCDFAKEVAVKYPMRVIMRIFGTPRSDAEAMLRMTQEFFNPQDKDLNRGGTVADHKDATPTDFGVLADYNDYFSELTRQRRANPTNDVASTIANSRINGELISDWDATSYYITIMTAGQDTTASSTACGVWALAERPELFQRIKADRTLIPGLVEEAIRWTTPLIEFMRTATQDYQLRGQTIRKGDWLMLSYPSANRDEEMFDRPDEFLVDRERNPQISFGSGAHVCLGQHLARMEMRIFFEELFNRLESVELAGPAKRNDSVFVGGVKTVPIRFTFN